jgi:ATP-dependent Clp protease ATP-binding subunit ClpB
LARALAEFLFDDESAMARIDMSEYMERHSVSRLIGAPPGYVGYEEGGQLTEQVRRKPYSVVLLDEIEKAHPEVFLGAKYIRERSENMTPGQAEAVYDDIKKNVLESLKQTLRPEFLNRIDDIVVFHPLTIDNVKEIVRLQFERIKTMLEEKGLKTKLSENALEYLVKKGYDPVFGARPLKRLLQKEVVNQMAKEMIAGNLKSGDTILIEQNDGRIEFIKN